MAGGLDFLSGLVGGAATEVSEKKKAQREQQNKLQQIALEQSLKRGQDTDLDTLLKTVGMAKTLGMDPSGLTIGANGKPSLGFKPPAPPKPPKELTPQQKSIQQNFRDLSAGIDRIDANLASDKGFKNQLLMTGIPFQPGAGNLADELGNASDLLLRMRSGAAINEQEYARLRALLPGPMDAISERFGNPNRARNKLVKFRQSANEILGTKSQPTATGSDTLTDRALNGDEDAIQQLRDAGVL